jgi:signal transduction histidine kinase/ABC-type nitrate/sulfonate/bicarbonate transport system substrate-binding protein
VLVLKFLFLFVNVFCILLNLEAKKLDEISLQLQWKHQFEFAGFYMAKEKGFYKDVGIGLSFKEYKENTQIIDDVIFHKNTYGITYSNLIVEYLEGKPIIFIANFLKQSPLAIVTKKDIFLPSDLKGKRVMGVSKDIHSAMLLIMFKKFGISLEDFINIPHSFSIDDFINNKVDAMTVFTTNETYFLDKRGIEYNLLNPTVYGTEFYDVNLFTSNDELLNHPERVQNFKDASIKGWKYALDNVEETIEIILKKYNSQNKTYDSLLYESKQIRNHMLPSIHPIGDINLERVEMMVDNYLALGLIPKDANVDLTNFIFKYNNKKLNLTIEEKNYLKEKKTIKICVDPNLLPFEAIKNGVYMGIGADIIDIFKNRFTLPISLVETKTFQESVLETKKNRCDMIPMIMDNKKDVKIKFSQSYLSTPIALITKLDVPFISDIHLLRDKKIVTIKGYSISRIIREKYPNLDLIEVDSIEEAFSLVRNNDAFAMAEKVISINNIFYKNNIKDLKITSKFDEKIYFSMGFNNDNIILPQIINKALANISLAEKKSIYNKWVHFIDDTIVSEKFAWNIFFILVTIILFVVLWLFIMIKLNKKYKKAQLDAEELSLVKSNFLAIISHEIRTPMNAILGMTYILSKTNLNLKQREYTEKIVNSSKNLLHLLNEILDFAKIEAGKLVIENRNFSLKTVLDELHDMFYIQVSDKDIDFQITFDQGLPMTVYGDSLRLSQILVNLLSNATKFTDYGRVELSIELLSKNRYKFTVSDTGIGLNEKQLLTLFNSFTQADVTTTRKYGGTGLGLSIVKELVSLLGGTISVKSEEFKGSEFIVILNLIEVDDTLANYIPINRCSLNNDVTKINTLEKIPVEEVNSLFIKLKKAVERKRPNEFEPILGRLSSIKLENQYTVKLDLIIKLLKKYDFKKALEILDEK